MKYQTLYQYDNLARQKYASPAPLSPAQKRSELERQKQQEQLKKKRELQRLEQEAKIRADYKLLAAQRRKTVTAVLAVMLVTVVALTYVVALSAKITEMSFYNSGLKVSIAEVRKSTNNLRANASEQMNMETLKAKAMENGLRKTPSNNVIFAHVAYAEAAAKNRENKVIYGFTDNCMTIENYVKQYAQADIVSP